MGESAEDAAKRETRPERERSIVVLLKGLRDHVDHHVLADRLGQNAEGMFGKGTPKQVLIAVGRDQDRRESRP